MLSYLICLIFSLDFLPNRKVKMHIHSQNQVTRIYNVIGTIRGTAEPGKIVCLQCNASMQ